MQGLLKIHLLISQTTLRRLFSHLVAILIAGIATTGELLKVKKLKNRICNEIYELISCPEKYKEKSKNARIRANELVDLQGYKTKIAKGYERCI